MNECQIKNGSYSCMNCDGYECQRYRAYQQGRADAIEEYHDKLSKEMHDLWRIYKADTDNRLKSNYMYAYSMVDLIAEQLKSQDT